MWWLGFTCCGTCAFLVNTTYGFLLTENLLFICLFCVSIAETNTPLNLDSQIKQFYVLLAHKVSLLFCMVQCSPELLVVCEGADAGCSQTLVPPCSEIVGVIRGTQFVSCCWY